VNQVSRYLNDGAIKGDPGDTLFVIAVGANDVLFGTNTTAAQTTGKIVSFMKKLREHGMGYLRLRC
jgi:lysophospholipase L1-like esterase